MLGNTQIWCYSLRAKLICDKSSLTAGVFKLIDQHTRLQKEWMVNYPGFGNPFLYEVRHALTEHVGQLGFYQ